MGGYSGYGGMQRQSSPTMGGGKGGAPSQQSQMSGYSSSPFGGSQYGDRSMLGGAASNPYASSGQAPMMGGKGGMPNPYGQQSMQTQVNPAYGMHNQFMNGMMGQQGMAFQPGRVDPRFMGPAQGQGQAQMDQARMSGLGSLGSGMMGMFGGSPNQQAMDAANQNAAFLSGVGRDYGMPGMPTLPSPAAPTATTAIERVFNRVGGEGSDNAGERSGADRGGMGGGDIGGDRGGLGGELGGDRGDGLR